MANNPYTQQALAADPKFAIRVRAALIAHAFTVLTEGPPVQSIPPTTAELAALATHVVRRNYARQVIADSDGATRRVVPVLVMRTNVFAFTTSYDFTTGAVVTASGDADILSQIAADWDIFAGV